jgi:DNA-directed RNA polymerase specialized sigma subunit
MQRVEISIDDRPIIIPQDITLEEIAFLELVKQNMLKKLNDRRKFIFVYNIELGKTQQETADVLQIDQSAVYKHLIKIREILAPFRHEKVIIKPKNK